MVDENLKISQVPAYSGYGFTKTHHHEPAANIDPSKVTLPKPCTVLITGGGRGLGEAIAIGFGKAGASDIILAARTTTELDLVAAQLRNISSSINVSTVSCDVTSEADVLKLVDVLGQTAQRPPGRSGQQRGLPRRWVATHHSPIRPSLRLASRLRRERLRRVPRNAPLAPASARLAKRSQDRHGDQQHVVAFRGTEHRNGDE